ncbi:MAG TPA: hypothetical protein VMH40_03725 [Myxococcaceae bacterium]|nr:hypothetical protein [Myxococcaceae bacterium]
MRRLQRWAAVVSGAGVLAVLLQPVVASAQTPESLPPPATEPLPPQVKEPPPAGAPEPPEAVTTEADPSGGWRHEFSPAWHMATFWSNEGSHYTFHSIALGYLMSVKSSGPYVHVSWVIPLQARQDGKVHSVSSIYQNAGGIDLLVGWQWRKTVTQTLEFEGGPGFHMNALNLGGQPGLSNFNAIQIGPGGMTILRWRPGWRPAKVGWTLGAVGALAFDVVDPLRSNDLRIGVALRIGAVIGVDLP